MPVISRFYGIVIVMYFNDHNPPHLHAKYAGEEARYDFAGGLLEGSLPRRAAKLVMEWISLHGSELESNWSRARAGEPLQDIEPLE